MFESHFCPSESGIRFPECDWVPDGFDGNEIGARCADISATDANYCTSLYESNGHGNGSAVVLLVFAGVAVTMRPVAL